MIAIAPVRYSLAAWKAYCSEHVRPKHAHDLARLARLDKLLKPETAQAWEKLAGDITQEWPAHLEPLTWQEALHNVIDTLIFPPSAPPHPGTEKVGSCLARMRRAGSGIPLLPATRNGANAQRNWVALYLRTWVIPAYFHRDHYEEIAELVDLAWGGGEGLSADQVRLMRQFHFRKPYRRKSR